MDHTTVDFHEALIEFIRAYQKQDRNCICCHSLSVTQCNALGCLCKCGEQSVNSLSDSLCLDKSTTSRVIDTLEKKSLVERVKNSEDKRSVLLRVTPEGAELYKQIEIDLLRKEEEILKNFSLESKTSFTQMLRQLTEALQTR